MGGYKSLKHPCLIENEYTKYFVSKNEEVQQFLEVGDHGRILKVLIRKRTVSYTMNYIVN